jgi:hypothetical protein
MRNSLQNFVLYLYMKWIPLKLVCINLLGTSFLEISVNSYSRHFASLLKSTWFVVMRRISVMKFISELFAFSICSLFG